jgi:hypothetical protein
MSQAHEFLMPEGLEAVPLAMFFRITSIFYLSLAPVMAAPLHGSRAAIPRCVQQAGRNDGFYRRLKWMQAQRPAVSGQAVSQGL